MQKRISSDYLRKLRNDISMKSLIIDLKIPWKQSQNVFRFLCPACRDFNTVVYKNTNLAICLKCGNRYNTIRMVMDVKSAYFLKATSYLTDLLKKSSSHADEAKSFKQELSREKERKPKLIKNILDNIRSEMAGERRIETGQCLARSNMRKTVSR